MSFTRPHFLHCFLVFAFLLPACGGKGKSSDAVSSATPAYSKGDRGPLPPSHDGYEVLGVREGIKGWAIRYSPDFVRGGEFYDDSAAEAMKEWGIRTIVSVSPSDKERHFARRHGLELVELTFDKDKGPTPADLRRFLDVLKQGKGPYYIHCVGGTQRAGALGLAYRIHVQGWNADRALVEFGRLGGNLKDSDAMLRPVLEFKP